MPATLQASGDAISGRAVFFCFALPGRDALAPDDAPLFEQWNENAGEIRWHLLDLESKEILEEPTEIAACIRSTPDTPRRLEIERDTLIDARKTIEKHINRTYLRAVDAPARINPC